MIHKSHSKRDLINIIQIFKFDLGDINKCKKKELIIRLQNYLLTIDKIEPELNVYMIYTLVELKQYLNNCNPKKVLSIKEKNEVINICKKIKNYCYNNYNLSVSMYNNNDEIINDAKFILPYGDIPSVRKACNLLNRDNNLNLKLNPTMSKQTIKELDNRRVLKIIKSPISLTITRKNVTLYFD
tara:strand:+ start:121 stop:672 length:552 start_codon:yes stop_codon:yes gene_type:complete